MGGNWNNGSNDGLFYWNCNNSLTDTNVNIGFRRAARAMMSYFGWLKHSDSYKLYEKYYVKIKLMKGVIANA